jgi:hypothetical protein
MKMTILGVFLDFQAQLDPHLPPEPAPPWPTPSESATSWIPIELLVRPNHGPWLSDSFGDSFVKSLSLS